MVSAFHPDLSLEDLFHATFENDLTAQILKIFEGEILAVNSATCEMFGYTQEEFLMLQLNEFVVGNIAEREKMREALKTGKANGIISFKKKDGAFFNGKVEAKNMVGLTGTNIV
ncbi:PAS domain S-box protein [Parasediminibacterium sp. JCM 36343]|uniref:PAS domain S-box protein n=1 Tax=Parasediminibacterium sp. JCM 36343 TaxID=3374279 RepID=UPI00397C21A9